MFKIDSITKEIKITRGDHGVIDFFIPVKNDKDYLKYQDNNGVIYWYDSKNKVLYDDLHEVSLIDIKSLTLQLHDFNIGDIVRFKVFEKKNCACVHIQVDTEVTEIKNHVDITLTKNDTRIGDLISKPVSYLYEVELNPDTKPQTIIGYDDDGEKAFTLYPEGGSKE